MIPIIITEPITWQKIEVPQKIVQHCAKFTMLDPYDTNQLSINNLRLLDCYWYNMNYYRDMVVVPLGW